MIKINNVSKRYDDNYVLKNISLELPNKGLIVIAGESGSGKTTLLNIIGGIISPSEGQVNIDGTLFSALKEKEIDEYRIKNIGYVFQSFNLLQLENVFDNVKMPLESISNCSRSIINKRVDDILKELDIYHLKRKVVNKLSGGEKQRVAIAKALINNPKIILCDEPTGALDNKNTKNICEILKRISLTSLVIVVTHDVKSFEIVSDRIIHIKDGSIFKDEKFKNKTSKKQLLVIANSTRQKRAHLPLSFKIKHAIHKITEKKFRFMISNFMLSMSLTGIGLSLIISTSLGKKIESAFSSLLNGNTVLVTSRNQSVNDFGAIFSSTEEDVSKIYDEYESYLDGYGMSYLVNFENFFKDANTMWINDDSYSYYLSMFSCRSINDYVWIDDTNRKSISPSLDEDLENDEVVLALTYVDMVNISYNFKIKRTFESLANYIYHNEITLSLHVLNLSWQYEDEQLFKVKGVFESNSSYLCHTSKTWNRYVFEDQMRFPSNDGSSVILPWEMYKIHYVATKGDASSFQNAILLNDKYHDFIFERTNYDVHPLLCKKDSVCDLNRLIVYNVDKNTFKCGSLFEIIKKNKDFKSYYFLSSGGYVSYGSMLLNGFRNPTYFSLSKEKIDMCIDADSKIDDNPLELSLPKGVDRGYFMDTSNNNVKFSSKINNLSRGRNPTNNKEIVISSALASSLDNGYDVLDSNMYISSQVALSDNEEGKIYNTARVKIVGIINSNKKMIYHNSSWTISFFRDELGMSSFLLSPSSLVIELDDNVDANKLVNRLNKTYYDYVFTSPIEEVSKSINQTLEFVKLIVILFSMLAGSISLLLLITLLLLNILENQHEVKIFKYSGISSKDINSQFVVDSLIQTLIAFMISTLELTIIDFTMGKVIDEMIGVSTGLNVNILPIAITFLIAITMTYIVSKGIIVLKTTFFKAH